jgi:hypothetical protein
MVPPWALSTALEIDRDGYERTFHFLPAVETRDHNLRIAPIRWIKRGETMRLTLHPGSGLCGFDLDMTCRLLRAADNVRLELEGEDPLLQVGLSSILDPYTFPSTTTSIRVGAGRSFQLLTPGVPVNSVVVTLRARADP